MMEVESYRQFAADCVRRAQNEETPDDKNLLLNVALAWLRLAQQMQTMEHQAMEPQAMEHEESAVAAAEQDEMAT